MKRETSRYHRVSMRTIHRLPILGIGISALGLAWSTYAFVSLASGTLPFYWAFTPVAYTIHQAADPTISDASDETALRLAFQAWEQLPTSSISFSEDQNPASRARTDWRSDDIHLMIWDTTNESGFFDGSAGLVAITPVDFDPSTGQILDADIIFNAKNYKFSTDNAGGTFDIQNVATHEVGHFIGLDHSAVVGATMNPFANSNDTRLRSLESDDVAGATAIYPASSTAGTISGRIVRQSGQGVSGAHVVAEDMDGRPASATLSDASGNFIIRGLPQGQYVIYAEPLDGPVRSNNFSTHTSGLVIETDFGTTFYGSTTGQSPPGNPERVFVSVGQVTTLGRTLLARAKLPTAMNLTSINLGVVRPGQEVTLSVFGTGLNQATRLEVPGTGVFTSNANFTASSASATLTVNNNALPQLFSVRVYNDLAGDAAVLTGGFEVRQPGPGLEGLSPTNGAPGTSVQVLGQGFQNGARVVFGSQVINGFVNGDGLSFSVPSVPNGTYSVAVENPDGQFVKVNQGFTIAASTVTSEPPPSTGSTPTSSPATTTPPPSAGAASAAVKSGGGGGGGGGCALTPRTSHGAGQPLLLLLALLLVSRRRRAS